MKKEPFRDLLHSRSLKATNPRLKLLTKLKEYNSAMPYSAIQKAMHPIDRVTLYRTLESLSANGVIHKAFQENNETYYAICGQKCDTNDHHHEHIHFKCLKCLAVTCVETKKAVEIFIPDYEVMKTNVYLEGVCKSCG